MRQDIIGAARLRHPDREQTGHPITGKQRAQQINLFFKIQQTHQRRHRSTGHNPDRSAGKGA